MKVIDIDIKNEGEVLVNSGHEDSEFKVKLLYIDLFSKYADCFELGEDLEGSPLIGLFAHEETLNIRQDKKDTATIIALPNYKGWEVFNCWVGRYTLTVILKEKL